MAEARHNVMISWSGQASNQIAEAFYEFLPTVIQRCKPWKSDSDIASGSLWSPTLFRALQKIKVGISCLTAENYNAPWILFEAGMITKSVGEPFACPFLFGLQQTDLPQPLNQLQCVRNDKEAIRKLCHDLNGALDGQRLEDDILDKSFDALYPAFAAQLAAITVTETAAKPHARDVADVLENVVERLTDLSRLVVDIPDAIGKSPHTYIMRSMASGSGYGESIFGPAAHYSAYGNANQGIRLSDVYGSDTFSVTFHHTGAPVTEGGAYTSICCGQQRQLPADNNQAFPPCWNVNCNRNTRPTSWYRADDLPQPPE